METIRLINVLIHVLKHLYLILATQIQENVYYIALKGNMLILTTIENVTKNALLTLILMQRIQQINA